MSFKKSVLAGMVGAACIAAPMHSLAADET